MTDTNSWKNNLVVAAFKIKIIWYVDFMRTTPKLMYFSRNSEIIHVVIWFLYAENNAIVINRKNFASYNQIIKF